MSLQSSRGEMATHGQIVHAQDWQGHVLCFVSYFLLCFGLGPNFHGRKYICRHKDCILQREISVLIGLDREKQTSPHL